MSPPPPPPPPAAPPPPPVKPKHVEGAPPEVAAPDEARLSLLESIRGAGGFYRANLKSAKDRKLGMIRKKGAASGGEDLMGDLKDKMLASGRACPKLRNQQKGIGPTLPSGRRLPPGAVPMFGPR
ncbi:hypothetical protein CAPTEDRAFT_227201 [Capitella teleta]|uniref:WH2 domain-containing protein n=1 Tax=Capitella teleta TaxID=283909 RepID=R7TSI2_CAPTE|nr:hypothetical protein CAPTEDRAFT_227201 [Capitella teleta]|eukprot:ELT96567.1 hypothetical protein CAPTEDRAFT_227201 [Capitella teleta]